MADIERAGACQTPTGTICQDREQIVTSRREQEASRRRPLPRHIERGRQVLKRYALAMRPTREGAPKLARHENLYLGMTTDLGNEMVACVMFGAFEWAAAICGREDLHVLLRSLDARRRDTWN